MNQAATKQLLYEFSLAVETLSLNIKASCCCSVVWRVADSTLETKSRR